MPIAFSRFPMIVGPTAGGKSSLAMAIVEELRKDHRLEACATGGVRAEIVSADAYQIYRGMDIGTAKPSREELASVPHHLIEVVEPGEAFSVHDWLAKAERAIGEIRARGGLPIVVGGTHLYAKALIDGMFDGPGKDEGLRAQLASMDARERRAELERVDPEAAQRIHPNDERRTIRALEVYRLTGRAISDWQAQWDRNEPRRDVLLVGLEWETESINRRINARVKQMVEMGLVEEARGLWESGRLVGQAGEALGYKQLIPHFEGRAGVDDAVEQIKIETRRFAKNQRTWLRRLRGTPGFLSIALETGDLTQHAQVVIEQCLTDIARDRGGDGPG